ncbi:hypothetical protein DICPUDRAFT_95724 [Dictyostelium purpureum]|uniref:Cytochrome P450 family protein n=1 Tax=Dictyostelium purpureum TaxID=5786 RepID=F0ZZY2_DICPU|nr:uncharacterized protein DICPUDRAFT_95724 [Dictyostelium purpureum]EGC30507.1 hypothetical protein DICPUDRAFT_95724 [Dictyostelium purpureum]|eukprot:XP_003292980.1 hypothetical protein DICPUDRAFT_95724 [Dictyostelium purpureum]
MNYIIILVIIIISLYIFKGNGDRKSKINSKIPSPFKLPILGNLLSMSGDLHLQFDKWYRQLGSIYRIKAGSVECVVLTGYPILRKAFVEHSEAFASRYRLASKLQLNGCEDIAFENNPRHAILKKVTLSEMTSVKIKRMEDHIIKETEKLISLLDKHAEDGKPFQINGYLHMFSLNIILRFLFGVDYPYEQVNQSAGIIKTVQDFFIEAGKPIVTDFLPFLSQPDPKKHPYFVSYAKLVKEVEDLIEKDQKQREQDKSSNDEQNQTILSKLIKEYEQGNITWNGVTNTAIDIVAAGSDTSANTMIFCLISLANNPDIQKKVHYGISSSLSGSNDIVATHSKYHSSLPYLSMVIKETFRKYPIAVLGIPHELTQDVEIGGYDIAAGTLIFQNIYSSHRSEEFFDQPSEFIPERFLETTNLNYGSSTNLVHFGVGVRDCIGKSLASAEIFTLLATLLNRYQFINPNDKPLCDIGVFGLAYQPPLTNLIIKKIK